MRGKQLLKLSQALKKIILYIIIYVYKMLGESINEIELSPDLTEENKRHLKIAQMKMTRMLGEFHAICKKYNLRYWLTGGTFVGCIMHSGVLPWDGDIDVCMIDTDFEIFEQHKDELSNTSWLQTRTTDKNYKSPINKIRDLNSHYIGWDYLKWHSGLQIDIVTFKIKENKIMPPWYPCKTFTRGNTIVDYDYDTIFPLKEVPFEDILVYMPNNSDNIIKQCYKEFYIPPLKNRKPHEGLIVSDRANPEDLIRYKDLYESRGILQKENAVEKNI